MNDHIFGKSCLFRLLCVSFVGVIIKDKVHEGSKSAPSQKWIKFDCIVCVCLP